VAFLREISGEEACVDDDADDGEYTRFGGWRSGGGEECALLEPTPHVVGESIDGRALIDGRCS
jgi:hypothetical protein